MEFGVKIIFETLVLDLIWFVGLDIGYGHVAVWLVFCLDYLD